jgi:hypothetical protein
MLESIVLCLLGAALRGQESLSPFQSQRNSYIELEVTADAPLLTRTQIEEL